MKNRVCKIAFAGIASFAVLAGTAFANGASTWSVSAMSVDGHPQQVGRVMQSNASKMLFGVQARLTKDKDALFTVYSAPLYGPQAETALKVCSSDSRLLEMQLNQQPTLFKSSCKINNAQTVLYLTPATPSDSRQMFKEFQKKRSVTFVESSKLNTTAVFSAMNFTKTFNTLSLTQATASEAVKTPSKEAQLDLTEAWSFRKYRSGQIFGYAPQLRDPSTNSLTQMSLEYNITSRRLQTSFFTQNTVAKGIEAEAACTALPAQKSMLVNGKVILVEKDCKVNQPNWYASYSPANANAQDTLFRELWKSRHIIIKDLKTDEISEFSAMSFIKVYTELTDYYKLALQ